MKTIQDLTQTCRSSVRFHSERWRSSTYWCTQPTLKACCVLSVRSRSYTNTMHQLCPSGLHEAISFLDYRVSGVKFQILKNYKTVHSKWIKETSGSESSENVLTGAKTTSASFNSTPQRPHPHGWPPAQQLPRGQQSF